jgi:hypothetical protein
LTTVVYLHHPDTHTSRKLQCTGKKDFHVRVTVSWLTLVTHQKLEYGIEETSHQKLVRTRLDIIELSVKSSKESTEAVSLLKTGNKVVEVG